MFVNLRKSDGITNPGIIALVNNCPNIEKLKLCELHKLTDTAMAHLAETLGSKKKAYSNLGLHSA